MTNTAIVSYTPCKKEHFTLFDLLNPSTIQPTVNNTNISSSPVLLSHNSAHSSYYLDLIAQLESPQDIDKFCLHNHPVLHKIHSVSFKVSLSPIFFI